MTLGKFNRSCRPKYLKVSIKGNSLEGSDISDSHYLLFLLFASVNELILVAIIPILLSTHDVELLIGVGVVTGGNGLLQILSRGNSRSQ